MKKAAICSCVLVLAWFAIETGPAYGEDIIRVEIGAVENKEECRIESFKYPNKDRRPVPQVTYGDVFRLQIRWNGPQGQVSFSDFRLAAFLKEDRAEHGEWWWDVENYTLELFEAADTERESPFKEFTIDGKDYVEAEGYQERRLILDRRGQAKNRGEEGAPQLIFFTLKISVLGEEGEEKCQFVLDPPWVGKPPTG